MAATSPLVVILVLFSTEIFLEVKAGIDPPPAEPECNAFPEGGMALVAQTVNKVNNLAEELRNVQSQADACCNGGGTGPEVPDTEIYPTATFQCEVDSNAGEIHDIQTVTKEKVYVAGNSLSTCHITNCGWCQEFQNLDMTHAIVDSFVVTKSGDAWASIRPTTSEHKLYLRKVGTTNFVEIQTNFQPKDLEIVKDDNVIILDFRSKVLYEAVLDASSGDSNSLSIVNTLNLADIGTWGSPYDVAVYGEDEFIISDWAQNCVRRVNWAGELKATYGQCGVKGSSNGLLNQPHGVSLDSKNNVIICDYNNQGIVAFNISGDYLYKLADAAFPRAVEFVSFETGENFMLVGERYTKKLKKYVVTYDSVRPSK